MDSIWGVVFAVGTLLFMCLLAVLTYKVIVKYSPFTQEEPSAAQAEHDWAKILWATPIFVVFVLFMTSLSISIVRNRILPQITEAGEEEVRNRASEEGTLPKPLHFTDEDIAFITELTKPDYAQPSTGIISALEVKAGAPVVVTYWTKFDQKGPLVGTPTNTTYLDPKSFWIRAERRRPDHSTIITLNGVKDSMSEPLLLTAMQYPRILEEGSIFFQMWNKYGINHGTNTVMFTYGDAGTPGAPKQNPSLGRSRIRAAKQVTMEAGRSGMCHFGFIPNPAKYNVWMSIQVRYPHHELIPLAQRLLYMTDELAMKPVIIELHDVGSDSVEYKEVRTAEVSWEPEELASLIGTPEGEAVRIMTSIPTYETGARVDIAILVQPRLPSIN